MNNWIVWFLQFVLPRRMWYRRFYLRSNHWRTLRMVIIDVRERCAKCKKTEPLDVHHMQYYKNGVSVLWHEGFEDLQVLCRACHKKEHERK